MAKQAENFVRTEFELEAVFTHAAGGKPTTFRDIVSISATFALNSIPVATLVVACGYEVQSSKDATIHEALTHLKPRDKVIVTLTIRSNDGDTDLMPNGTGVIFEGYYAGSGYQRSNDSASYTLHLIHWLDDLNCSSMINGNWHPGVPHDLAQAANMTINSDAADSGNSAIPTVDNGDKIITMENIKKDLWGQVLKPVFEQIANFSHANKQGFVIGDEVNDENELTNGNNAAAKLALARMPGAAPLAAKLPLFMGGPEANAAVLDGVRVGINLIVKNNMAYSSFWSKLIGEFAPEFLFAVSPCPEFANVIPFFGGLSAVWKEIDGREYTHANFNSNLNSLIESIQIRYPQTSSSGVDNGGGGLSYYKPYGIFPKINKDLRGQIIVKDPPGWLANCIKNEAFTPITTSQGRREGDTTNKPPAQDQQTDQPADTLKKMKESGLPSSLCEHWYKTEILSQRYGELSGKLRFDIAPGSMVKIKEPDLSTSSEVAVYAAVTHVSFLINAEQHIAGTSFTLINLRTELENNDKLFAGPAPPLYTDPENEIGNGKWVGGPLVRGLS